MSGQPDLFSYTPPPAPPRAMACSSDPQTSHDAAASIAGILPALEAIVLEALYAAGRRGMTVDELVAATSIDKVTVSPRLRPLCEKGLAEALGKRKGLSGRSQTIWIARGV
ncbi:MAG TPA: hypothetical protein VIH63_05005 [Xanthobacteraceae bacterium]